MCILVIDLSYQTGSVFTMNLKGEVLDFVAQPDYKSLSSVLQQLTKKADLPLKAIALPRGPGAFTPLRLATSVALAHSLLKGTPLIPYSSFLGLVPLEDGEGKLQLDARSKSAFTTFYQKRGANVEFEKVELESIDEEPGYETCVPRLATHIKNLFEIGAFCNPLELKLEYIKQPR